MAHDRGRGAPRALLALALAACAPPPRPPPPEMPDVDRVCARLLAMREREAFYLGVLHASLRAEVLR